MIILFRLLLSLFLPASSPFLHSYSFFSRPSLLMVIIFFVVPLLLLLFLLLPPPPNGHNTYHFKLTLVYIFSIDLIFFFRSGSLHINSEITIIRASLFVLDFIGMARSCVLQFSIVRFGYLLFPMIAFQECVMLFIYRFVCTYIVIYLFDVMVLEVWVLILLLS